MNGFKIYCMLCLDRSCITFFEAMRFFITVRVLVLRLIWFDLGTLMEPCTKTSYYNRPKDKVYFPYFDMNANEI